jgi:MinD superfamily P-loop ATPase
MCINHCKFNAIDETFRLIEEKCEGCGVCTYICPESAIEMTDSVIGRIIHREIDKGDFVYGQLIPGEETSGKLVSEVRRLAKKVADQRAIQSILIDGAPGIACNVIASVTGVKHVIIVTEPTVSGLHDLQRVYELVSRFRVKVMVVINKSDLSIKGLEAIRHYCLENSIPIGLEIPFNKEIVASISALKLPADDLRNFYEKIGFKTFVESLNLL